MRPHALLLTLALAATTGPVHAWEPTRPIEFVVPANPGGGADQMGRIIGAIADKHRLSPRPIIVINKPGGAGAEAFLHLKSKAGDPHTILMPTSNIFTTPLHTGIPFHWKQLTPIARLALDEFILWVNADTPYKTAKEYFAAVKAKPKAMKMGGTGAAQEDQIITIQLEHALGLKFIYVPFKGGGEVCVNLVGKHVDSTLNNPSECAAHWRGGRVRPLAVFDAARISRFQLLQGGARDRAPALIVFDCLFARGKDLRGRPLAERRTTLEHEARTRTALRLARRIDANGLKAFERARERGLEGIVAKDAASPYEAGVRARTWLKVKVRAEEEFVIGGYTAPAGARAHFGALLIGAWAGDRLRYAGKVGTGFDGRMLANLMARFRPLVRDTSPFADAPRERKVTWLEPKLVAQVGFTEWTGDGRLRHPTFLGLRDDKAARQVSWSRAGGTPS